MTALSVAGSLEVAGGWGLDFVGGVTGGAVGGTFVSLEQPLAVDAAFESLFDAEVAFAAGSGHVEVMDGRVTIHAAFDVMNAVAIVAGGGHDQATFEQGLTVNAVQVVGRGFGVFHPVFFGEAGIAVAPGAGAGEVEFEDR